ncbi:hypothetical protein DGG96_11590 [Legionella qingyii]|uniref:Uncharacterized protein n=1 Tax=Legionella qingyii TaxID=2184757 RepID=A0A317U506_9GAMM|nr:hypothetical protein [Legionella qingyii]PWY54538.1 hypothetical protein DGG96_16140 [Legionella qingyii]PWY55562.1 hypothetical protein DGG96_11590 [Legionella qingyii]RUR21430.1 hypothetical protein ELY20_12040 [Legionella qingyii]RUR24751.1 hypothetical protein ELY16_11280 [Legionella qingyii]
MTYLKFNQSGIKNKINSRLVSLGLESDERMIQTLEENPQYINRLTSLFSVLKKYNVVLNDLLHKAIASNVAQAGAVVDLLEFMHEVGIDPEFISLERVFVSAKSETTLKQGMQILKTNNSLDSASLNLMFAYPEESLLIADLIVNFQKHAYSTEKIIEKLHQFSEGKMSTVIELFTLLLSKNLYYFECFDIFLRQQKNIDKIYEGAKKLVAKDKLAPSYFEVIEKDPMNANILANIILLLDLASLIDYRKTEDVLIASKLGVGAFHFLTHLQHADMLDAENYNKVCRYNSPILNHPDVIKLFSSFPLFEEFDREELEKMLSLITKKTSADADLEEFIEMIEKHQFSSKQHP